MSQIIEAIRRIGISYKERKYINLPVQLLSCFPPHNYQSVQEAKPETLTIKQLEIVNQYLGRYQPWLSLEKIEELTQPYLFQLPQEFYDLYQMGNGCLPIRVLQEDEINNIYNYSFFPSYANRFLTLQEAIACYQDLLVNSNSRVLPFCSTYDEGDVVLSIVGSEDQQETSPVLMTYSDDICQEDPRTMKCLFPSLTNMMLAYAELSEHKWTSPKNLREDILAKYGCNPDLFYLVN